MRKIILLTSFLVIGLGIPLITQARSITSISPTNIIPGESMITINGSGFGNDSDELNSVCFAYSECIYSFTSWDSTQITFKAPVSLSYLSDDTKVKVKVLQITPFASYSIYGPKIRIAPIIGYITPDKVFPGTTITIRDAKYISKYPYGDIPGIVQVGGRNAEIIEWKSYRIDAKVPTGVTGSVDVVVLKPAGISSNAFKIQVLLVSTINSIEPSVIVPGATRVTVRGSGFGDSSDFVHGDSDIYMGDIRITRAVWTDTAISFDVPATVKSDGYVYITTGGSPRIQGPRFTIRKVSSITNDPFVTEQYYLDTLGVQNAWNITKGSDSIIVAVIDDGVYINHPDLQQHIWVNRAELVGDRIDNDGNGYTDDIYGWDFRNNTSEMTTLGTHGTQVAGIIGATTNNQYGIAGINWNVKLMSLIVCNRYGCSLDAASRAIKYAADMGADVINISLGTTGVTSYTDTLNDAIRYAYNKGVVIVAAAGNGDIESGRGQNLSLIPQSPICNDNNSNMVLGVGAVDSQGQYVGWSNYGRCVDVVAPGLNIYSTAVSVYSDGKSFIYGDGTSFSAPIVSGLAALLRGKYPTMPNSEVINRIKRHARNRSEYNNALGAGLVNFYATLSESYTAPIPTPTPTPDLRKISSVRPADYGLKEGDIIGAADYGDPDIFIVNEWGYKRLFLNPVIFSFYGHLGFGDVKKVPTRTRDDFIVSGLFRNCETGDEKVYGIETTGEDTGMLHWVNMTGNQAASEDPDFFKKIFCINNNEFNWYTSNGTVFGSDYTSLNQVPIYSR